MIKTTTLHRATIEDVARLVPLFDGYRSFYEKSSDLKGAKTFLEARLAKSESVIFMALVDDEPAGFTQLFPIFSSMRMIKVWLLNDLYVDPNHRRNAIGRALMLRAIEHSRETGYSRVELATGVSNHQAQSLYESLGFEREVGYYHYSLTI